MTQLVLSVSKPYYVPGDIVDGVVELQVTKTARLRSIDLVSNGIEHTHIRVSHGKHSYTYTETNPMHQYSACLSGPAEVPPGTYSYPFRFQLPPTLLPTYRGTNALVRYTVTANADIPFWFDAKQTVELLVTLPHQVIPVDARPLTFYSDSAGDGSKPAFQVDIPRSSWFAGESLTGSVTLLRNPPNKRIRKAEVVLQMMEFARASSYSREVPCEVARVDIPGDSLASGGAIPFRIPIPRECYSCYNGVFSRLAWVAHVNLDIAFGFDIKGAQEILVYNAV